MPDWVLMYHAVADGPADPHRVQVTPERFRRQMRWLHQRGRRGVSLRTLPAHPGAVGLTFDDGYADFAETVVPILAEHGFTATVYVVAGRLGGTNDWDDGPTRRLMTADQVREVAAAGMEVASHTLTHARLPDLPDDGLSRELRRSRAHLEEVLDAPVTGFAYPYGAFGAREARAVADSGYAHAAAIDPRPLDGPWAVPRTYVGQADTPWRLHAKRLRHHHRTRGART
ncbi:polysaccharide deacetylase family protein [Actinomycetospora chiangmaiensis]|uniref:polysaccharide deacetylase family protein n=1 Tax=Actinomycetospora chiangmaiensis TaxID=402650 RepID=UPI00037BBFDB|nr:polysaccharide deacetylase family protein [Actinomycetospora chiangmaiensis]